MPQIGTRRIAHRRFEQFLRPVLKFVRLVPPPVRLPHGLRDPLPVRRSALGDGDLLAASTSWMSCCLLPALIDRKIRNAASDRRKAKR